MALPALDSAPMPGPTPTPGRRNWGARRWLAALAGAVVTAVVIGVPTDVIPNPVFGRPVPVTWWSVPVLVVTSVLAGLLFATYVRDGRTDEQVASPNRTGGIAGLLTFFAVGCPVCNKLVVVALGTTGAVELFAPIQPLLAVASVALLAFALWRRLAAAQACPVAGPAGVASERDLAER
jgi:hypothetical protein